MKTSKIILLGQFRMIKTLFSVVQILLVRIMILTLLTMTGLVYKR